MVNDLADRPAAGTVRRVELTIGQPRYERPDARGRLFEHVEMRMTGLRVERRRNARHRTNRIAKRVDVCHRIHSLSKAGRSFRTRRARYIWYELSCCRRLLF